VIALARDSLRLPRIKAGHFLDNPASGQVLKKLGFRPTGIIARRYSAGRGGEAPCKLFELGLRGDDAKAGDQDPIVACRMIAA
jgi:RimJ/RimL family protein N-acetyltransferase